MNDLPLSDLVTIARRRDKADAAAAAYAEIVRRFEDMARATGLRWLGDTQLAEDAAQEAFIEAYLTLGELREPEAFPGWFRRIVLKHCDRQLRRNRREQPLEAWLQLADGTHDVLDTLYVRERVSSALDSLTERQRTLTRMFYLEGYSQQEIVHQLHWPLSTVKKQLFMARKTLREEMADMADMTKTTGTSVGDLSLRVKFFLALRTRDAAQVRQLAQAHRELLGAYTEWAELENSNYWPLGYTALHYAVAIGDTQLVDALIVAGADVNALTRNQFATALHVAAMHQRPDMMARLLAAGANVGAANGYGMTALHFAAYRGILSAVQVLLDAGAAPSLKDSGRHTPLDWALHRAHTPVIEALRQRGAKTAIAAPPDLPKLAAAGPLLVTGIKAIDLFAPIVRGGVNTLFTPLSGVGKVVQLEQTIDTVARQYGGHTIFLGIEDNHYTGVDFGLEVRDIGLEQAVTLVFGARGDAQRLSQAVDQALAQMDTRRECVLMVDASYAESEAMRTRLESVAGNTVTVLWYGEHSAGAEPEYFARAQSLITFDMWRAVNGFWPAIDPVRSQSAVLDGRHAGLVARAKRLLRRYEDLRVIVERDPRGLDGLETDADRATVARARRLHAYLSQPFPITELFANTYGEYVPLAWALDGLEAVLDGRADDVSEAELRTIAGTWRYFRR